MSYKLSLQSLLLALVIGLSSCNSNSLNRDTAKSAISDYIKNKNDSNLLSKQTTIYAVVRGEGERYNDELKTLEPYIDAGLLKLKKRDVRPETEPIYWYIYSITAKGKPYVKSQIWEAGYPTYHVKTYDLFVNEITGIKFSGDNKQALVEFTLSKENITPFGAIESKSNDKVVLNAFFNLYDDGWRVEKVGYPDDKG